MSRCRGFLRVNLGAAIASDIADVVHFLASPDSRWVTAQITEASGCYKM